MMHELTPEAARICGYQLAAPCAVQHGYYCVHCTAWLQKWFVLPRWTDQGISAVLYSSLVARANRCRRCGRLLDETASLATFWDRQGRR